MTNAAARAFGRLKAYPAHWTRLTFAVWGFSLIIMGGYPMIVEGHAPEPWMLLWLPPILVSGAALSLLLSLFVLRVEPRHWLTQFASLFAATMIVSLVQSAFDHLLWHLFHDMADRPFHSDFVTGVGFNLLVYVWIFGLYVTGLKLLLLLQRAGERDAEIARARAAAGRAELAALRYQIQPEVLFTTLSSASHLVADGRPDRAVQLVDRLSGFMRGQLAADTEGGSTLGDEIDALDSFIALERMRTGAEIELNVDCPDELDDMPGPAFLLQPLMEARLRHVLPGRRETLHIELEAKRLRGVLKIVIRDDGGPQDEADFDEISVRLRRLGAADTQVQIRSRRAFLAEFDLPVQ